jgi:hypothetical protein
VLSSLIAARPARHARPCSHSLVPDLGPCTARHLCIVFVHTLPGAAMIRQGRPGSVGPRKCFKADDGVVCRATALADVHLADNAAASTSEVQPQAFHRTEPTEADKGGRTFGSRYLGDEDDMWQHNAWSVRRRNRAAPLRLRGRITGIMQSRRRSTLPWWKGCWPSNERRASAKKTQVSSSPRRRCKR